MEAVRKEFGVKKDIFTSFFGMFVSGGQMEGVTNLKSMDLPTVIPVDNIVVGSINGKGGNPEEIIRWLDNIVWVPWLLILL